MFFDPVVDIIRQVHPGEFIQDCTVTYTIKCFGEVQGIYYDIRVSGKEGSDCVQQVDKSCSSGTSWLESELVMEAEPWRWRSEWGYIKSLTIMRSTTLERTGVMEIGPQSES